MWLAVIISVFLSVEILSYLSGGMSKDKKTMFKEDRCI